MGYYPFEEGKAGALRDNHKTSESSSYLLASNEIVQLAKEVLSPEQYEEAELIARQLSGKKSCFAGR